MAGPLAGTPGGRRPRAVPLVRSLLRWTARAAGLLVLLTLAGQQLLEFRAQPVSSTVVRKKAPFPRLTVCPAASLTDYSLLLERQQQLVNDSISLLDYYNLTTPEMVGEMAGVMIMGDHVAFIPFESDLGAWKQRYYLFLEKENGLRHTRCLTFEASSFLEELSSNELEMELYFQVSPLFTSLKQVSHRLFVHGPEVPNVLDLDPNQHGVEVPSTIFHELQPGERIATYRVTARLRQLANVDRRPCRSEPGYSLTQCLKECLWRRLAAHIGCRLPHMVAADAYLPEIRGPVDHLPMCKRPVDYQLQKTKGVESDQCVSGAVLQFDLASEELQEILLFTYSTLMANLGGFIGLITGFSYFTLIATTETLLVTVTQSWQTRRHFQTGHKRDNRAAQDLEAARGAATVGLAW
ncbi:hypothetical protein FJT64_000926 [Amphibalanus amphitrite]|uniref:Uncharacterized protein n=1 Tax=Amphibalanus amphitrite TaxID=1232801 RepID=A0A6A4VJW5_AMPAM|nr:hypothetical protein FJT64_000926 [Amphibalanus amphitrite]